MKKIFMLIVAILSTPCLALAAGNQTATSCARAAVQTAIDNSSDGYTVTIPAGNCSWDATVTMDKAIRLTGAGVGVTVITNTHPTNYNSILTSDYSGAGDRKIDNFTITGRGTGGDAKAITINGSTRIHITNMTFLNQSIGIVMNSPPNGNYGLIDYCSLQAGQTNSELIQATSTDPTTDWSYADFQGTEHAWYIENNTFTSAISSGLVTGHAFAGSRGARVVFRDNTVEDMDFDAHGTCSNANSYLSTRWYEVYRNTWRVTSGLTMNYWLYLRGGTGIVYSNAMTASGTLNLSNANLQEQQLGYPTNCACWTGGYPAQYQIGRGQNNTLSPLWLWSNTVNGSTVGAYPNTGGDGCGLSITDYVLSGRDFYVNAGAKPGYTALGTHTLAGGGGADTTPPVIDNLSPSGVQPCNYPPNAYINRTLTTNEGANCKVSWTDQMYADMTATFDSVDGFYHTNDLSQSCGASYLLYVACQDYAGNETHAQISYSISGQTEFPVCTIVSPTDPYTTANATVTLTGTASDTVGVTSVTWANNRGGSGTATCTGCPSGPGVSIPWSISNIALYSGVNVITVTARDAAGNTTPRTVTVTYTPGTGTDHPSDVTGIRMNGTKKY